MRSYLRNYVDSTCYRMSNNHPVDTIPTFADGVLKCRGYGARLWEPRVIAAITMVQEAELNPGHYYNVTGNSLTAIGIILDLTVLPGPGEMPAAKFRSDGQDVPKVLMEAFPWEVGYPIVTDPLALCVAFGNGSMINAPCAGYFEGIRTANSNGGTSE